MSFSGILFIGLHALAAWVLIELFVNRAHSLTRCWYVLWHYVAVIASFAALFCLYFHLSDSDASVFSVTLIAMGFVIFLEVVVFRYLYCGERWFLNFVDWIFPMFLATSTIYLIGTIVK